MKISAKLNTLSRIINEIFAKGKSVLALSGGVDSVFLLYFMAEISPDNTYPLCIESPYTRPEDIQDAVKICSKLNIPLQIIQIDIPSEILNNPPQRCYLCKKKILGKLRKEADQLGAAVLVDGNNADDLNSGDRPGLQACRELDVRHPLAEAQLSKSEIRKALSQYNPGIAAKGASSCLLTRLPFNTVISNTQLEKIQKAESFLLKQGFRDIRVRIHDNLARIECGRQERKDFTEEIMDKTAVYFDKLGFQWTALDLSGFKSGTFSMQKDNKK